MLVVYLILLVAAFVLFVIGALGIWGRAVALGLACWVLVALLQYGRLV